MNYVTHEELDKIIQLYEKIGAAEKAVGEMDGAMRLYQKSLIDDLELRVQQSMDQKISALSEKIQIIINKSEETIQSNINKQVSEVLDNAKSHITEIVLNTVYTTLQEFKATNEAKANSEAVAFKTKIEAELNKISTIVSFEVESKIKTFKSEMTNEIHEKIYDVINHAGNLFAKNANTIVENYADEIVVQIKEFKDQVREELSHKVVDKLAIENKFIEIENEMKDKVQQVINFQLDQARHMMEQSARAEINESLKTLTGNFLGSL